MDKADMGVIMKHRVFSIFLLFFALLFCAAAVAHARGAGDTDAQRQVEEIEHLLELTQRQQLEILQYRERVRTLEEDLRRARAGLVRAGFTGAAITVGIFALAGIARVAAKKKWRPWRSAGKNAGKIE